MRRRLLALPLVALALAASVAGCGGSAKRPDVGPDGHLTKSGYAKALGTAGAVLTKSFANIPDETPSNTSAAQIGKGLDAGAAALDGAARSFAKLKPPASLAAAHAELIQGLSELGAVFHTAAQAARQNDPRTLTRTVEGLSTSAGVRKIGLATAALKAQGISLAGQN